MKKSILFVASLAMSLGAFAQWTLPVPETTQEMLTDGTTKQYLYNLEAGGFFAGANNYGTRASVASFADPIMFVPTGETEDDYVYMNFKCFPSTKGKWLYVSCNNYDAMWVDAGNAKSNTDYPNTEFWYVTKFDSYYKIFNISQFGLPLGTVDVVKGNTGDTRLYFAEFSSTYLPSEESDEEVPVFGGNLHDKWVFISEEEYEALKPKVECYQASEQLKATIENAKKADESHDYSRFQAVYERNDTVGAINEAIANINAFTSLKAALDKAVEEYSKCDFSSVKAVYDNSESTTEELQAAQKQIKVIEVKYECGQATWANPQYLNIGDGSSFDPWTRTFTGTGTTGDPATNTWSTEAKDGADGTDMLTPFCQVWTGRGGILSDQTITQEIFALPGVYKLNINTRAYNEAGGINSFEGLTMFFGDTEVNLQDQATMTSPSGKSTLWKKDGFTIVAIVREAGNIQFGFKIKDANFNWISFKNTSLIYYGNEDADKNAISLVKDEYAFAEYDKNEVNAKEDLLNAYNQNVKALESTQNFDEFMTLVDSTNAAKIVLDANIAAYDKLLSKLEEYLSAVDDRDDLGGDDWDTFSDFMVEEEGTFEGYPTILPFNIVDRGLRPFTTDEINEYLAAIAEKYSYALAHSLKPGADCTSMLTNPSFQDGFTGWSNSTNTPLNTNVYKVGGKDFCKDVEVYDGVVDIQQEIEGVSNGIYSITCQAFERPGGNGSFNGSEDAKVFLFMNEFQTPVMNICKDAVPEDQVENLTNCYVSANEGDVTGSGAWPYDYNVTDCGWIPNSVDGASYAFRANRYVQKVYGVIENNKMCLGLTSNGKKAHWVLWANFKVTFEGKTLESLNKILPTYVTQLAVFYDTYKLDLNTEEVGKIEGLLEEAQKATDDEDVDAMFNCLGKINSSIKRGREVLDAITEITSIINDVDNATMEYGDADQAIIEAANEWMRKFNECSVLSSEEILAAPNEGKLFRAKLRSSSVLKSIGDYSDASAKNPKDFTAFIENPSFEDGLNGWTVVTGGDTKAAELSNDTYRIDIPEEEGAGSYTFNTWASSIPEGGLPASQLISGLPAGTYELTAILASDEGNVVTLSAGSESADFTMEGDKTTPNYASLLFVVAENENITIKVNSATSWYKADNFKLKYLGTEPPTSVEEIADVTKSVPTQFFSVAGTRSTSLQKGINIVKMANGDVKKVIVK